MPRDFFISFNKADRDWAVWIAWVLEEHGYSVFFQDWDFRGNFIEHMDRSHREAERTLAVLSENYFGSDFTLAEWSARLAQDPAGKRDLLVPVKVGAFADAGILMPLVHADLTRCKPEEAKLRLLQRVKIALDPAYRPKPLGRPLLPEMREVMDKPTFPGKVVMPAWLMATGVAAMVAIVAIVAVFSGDDDCVVGGNKSGDVSGSTITITAAVEDVSCD